MTGLEAYSTGFLSLRTGPTTYKGFCARLGPRGKSRSLQGQGIYFLRQLALNINKNADISIFLKKKKRKNIFSQISLESKHIKKDL